MGLRVGTTTKLTPADLVERSVAYFHGELGLNVVWRSPFAARFEGGGGHVQLSATAQASGSEAELETMEWERQVREFIGHLPH